MCVLRDRRYLHNRQAAFPEVSAQSASATAIPRECCRRGFANQEHAPSGRKSFVNANDTNQLNLDWERTFAMAEFMKDSTSHLAKAQANYSQKHPG
jgi:hypothetical protein